MTGLVIRLEKDRMVKRQDDPKDRRASLVNLTKAGRREIEGYRERAMNVLLGGIEGFSEEDQRVLARSVALLQQLNNQIAAGLDS